MIRESWWFGRNYDHAKTWTTEAWPDPVPELCDLGEDT